jgi:WD40 repeat protein
VNSVALGEIDGDPVIVSGGQDGSLRVWDARTRQPRGQPLVGREKRRRASVLSVAIGPPGGEPLIISGDSEGRVRLWDARTRRPRGEPLTGHRGQVSSVALGEIDGGPVVVSGGEDGVIRVWDVRAVPGPATPRTSHAGGLFSIAVGAIQGDPVVVSGGESGDVRVWNAQTGRPRGKPLAGHESKVVSVTLAEIDGEPVIVSAGKGTVGVQDARSGRRVGRAIRFEWGVAVGEHAGELVIVSAGRRTLQMWDARTGQSRGSPVELQSEWGHLLALGHISGESVAVFGYWDGTLEVVDLFSGRPRFKRRAGRNGLPSVAIGTIDGEPVIVSGAYDDGSAQVWETRSGRRRGKPLVGHRDEVSSLAVGEISGQPVIISGGSDGVVQVWDPRRARSVATLEPGAAVQGLALGSRGDLAIATSLGLVMVDLLSPGVEVSSTDPPAPGGGARSGSPRPSPRR